MVGPEGPGNWNDIRALSGAVSLPLIGREAQDIRVVRALR